MEPISPPCPQCGSTETFLYVSKNGCNVYACRACRFRFVYPIPAVDQVYGEDYFSGGSQGFGYVDYDADKEPMVPTFKKYLEIVRRYVPEARTLLDVGAATGFFVELAARDGFDAEGVEYAAFAVAEGERKGRKVRVGTVHDMPEDASYDVITMLDVIEHVPDPEADVRAGRARMPSGAVLVINTPDTGSGYARLMGKRWHLITPPEHIAYFDRKNLKQMLERNGFKVEWSGTLGKQFTIPYIFSTLYAWQGLGVWKWLAEKTRTGALSRLKIPINLRDNMLVVARAV